MKGSPDGQTGSFDRNPRLWFLIDGIGAAVSILLAGLILPGFGLLLGLPVSALWLLASAACIPLAYDVWHFIRERVAGTVFNSKGLRGIALINLCYVILSLGIAMWHRSTMTVYGWLYILSEAFVILFLASLEFRAAARLS
jgi:hypothetical protein